MQWRPPSQARGWSSNRAFLGSLAGRVRVACAWELRAESIDARTTNTPRQPINFMLGHTTCAQATKRWAFACAGPSSVELASLMRAWLAWEDNQSDPIWTGACALLLHLISVLIPWHFILLYLTSSLVICVPVFSLTVFSTCSSVEPFLPPFDSIGSSKSVCCKCVYHISVWSHFYWLLDVNVICFLLRSILYNVRFWFFI